ncbi:MAG: hypothetical protein ACLQNE_19905 [Thermoguttaceae bacterium]|jgi:hypothetical protein
MRVADLSGSAAKLDAAIDAFQLARNEAAASWNDQTRQGLEEHYFLPLDAKCRRALDALRRLTQVLDKAMRECDSI